MHDNTPKASAIHTACNTYLEIHQNRPQYIPLNQGVYCRYVLQTTFWIFYKSGLFSYCMYCKYVLQTLISLIVLQVCFVDRSYSIFCKYVLQVHIACYCLVCMSCSIYYISCLYVLLSSILYILYVCFSHTYCKSEHLLSCMYVL